MIGRNSSTIDRLALCAASAARAVGPLVGLGGKNEIDAAAVEKLRESFALFPWTLTVANCEGEKDEAPRFATGERLGDAKSAGESFQLLVDPVDGTSAVASASRGAVVALALADDVSTPFRASCNYVEKIAVPAAAASQIKFAAPIEDNLAAAAAALGIPLAELRVAVLDRKRNRSIADRIRQVGAQLALQPVADLAATIDAVSRRTSVDVAISISGLPETQIAAVCAASTGAALLARAWPAEPSDNVATAADIISGPRGVAIAGITQNPLTAEISWAKDRASVWVFTCTSERPATVEELVIK